jgi:hypothetical protein
MKRIAAVFFVIASLISISRCAGKKEVKPYRVGLVNFVIGKAVVIGKNGLESPAVVGMPLDIGMKIKTVGKDSLCEIYFNENALKLFGDSVVDIEWLTYNMKSGADETSLYLEKGRVFTSVKNKLMKDEAFVVKTQTSIASVRGTEFFVSEKSGASTVSCIDGKLEVRGKRDKTKPVVVTDHEEASSVKGAAPKKAAIDSKKSSELEKQAVVEPVTKENKDLFDKLDEGDPAAVKTVSHKIESLSGSVPDKKEKKPEIDLFFFKG